MKSKDYSFYIELLKKYLSDRRFNHSLEVATSAEYLAEKYGAHNEKLYMAGLLHDIFKEKEQDEIFKLADKYRITMTELERETPKLWHAIVGAGFIEHELKIKDKEVLNSVRYHTTGRAGMSLCEKILYVADFVSADRDYDGVEIMREKAKTSLDDAMLEGLSFTIAELKAANKPIHPDTLEAYEEIKNKYNEKGLI